MFVGCMAAVGVTDEFGGFPEPCGSAAVDTHDGPRCPEHICGWCWDYAMGSEFDPCPSAPRTDTGAARTALPPAMPIQTEAYRAYTRRRWGHCPVS